MKCVNCKFCGPKITLDDGTEFIWCSGFNDAVDMKIAEDDAYPCEGYVGKLDVNHSKA